MTVKLPIGEGDKKFLVQNEKERKYQKEKIHTVLIQHVLWFCSPTVIEVLES